MVKAFVYLLWLAFWWSHPMLALYVGGRFVNYFVMGIVVAITTSIAGWQLLWSNRFRDMP